MKMTGKIHNARQVTVTGCDCWIAAVLVDGRFRCCLDDVSEHDTYAAAVAWLAKKLQKAYETKGVEL